MKAPTLYRLGSRATRPDARGNSVSYPDIVIATPADTRPLYVSYVDYVALTAHLAPTVDEQTLRICGVIADHIDDGKLSHVGLYRNAELAGFVRRLLNTVRTSQARADRILATLQRADQESAS